MILKIKSLCLTRMPTNLSTDPNPKETSDPTHTAWSAKGKIVENRTSRIGDLRSKSIGVDIIAEATRRPGVPGMLTLSSVPLLCVGLRKPSPRDDSQVC